jgi:two-component system, chemotaxis family, chemotaxis protein CheY
MPHKVLVVDDSDVTRAMIIKTLELARVPVSECLQAENGQEALQLLEDNWVDIVFADLNMPIMGGREMLRLMRTTPELADIPVIVISSEHCDPSSLPLSWASGYVRKPFTPEAIRDAVEGLTTKKDAGWNADWLLERFDYVLQTITFMFTEKVPEGEPLPVPPSAVCAEMAFFAGGPGKLWLGVSPGLAEEMAKSALGVDELDREARQAADVVGEILNMTAGLVTDALARGAPVQLFPPEITERDAAGWEALLRQPIATACLVENEPLLVALATSASQ